MIPPRIWDIGIIGIFDLILLIAANGRPTPRLISFEFWLRFLCKTPGELYMGHLEQLIFNFSDCRSIITQVCHSTVFPGVVCMFHKYPYLTISTLTSCKVCSCQWDTRRGSAASRFCLHDNRDKFSHLNDSQCAPIKRFWAHFTLFSKSTYAVTYLGNS